MKNRHLGEKIMHFKLTYKFLIALICYMPIMAVYIPKTNFGAGIPDIGPVRLFAYLTMLFFFVEASINKSLRIGHKWLLILFVFYSIYIMSILWSEHYTYNTSTAQALFNNAIVPFLVAVVAMNVFREKTNITKYIKHIMVAALLLSLIGMIQMIMETSVVHGEIRSAATLRNPNVLAIFLVATIPCIMYGIDKRILNNKIHWMTILAIVGGIISTVSRKGAATMLVAFFLYFILTKQFKKIVISLIILILLAVALLSYQVISQRFTKEEVEHHISGKFNMAYAGLQMFIKSPVIGLGYKGYYENFKKYFLNSKHDKYDAHNIYITALTNYGIVGFIPFMAIFLYPLFFARKILKSPQNSPEWQFRKDMAVICISTTIPFMMSGYFAGGMFYTPVLMMLFYTQTSFLFVETPQSTTVTLTD